MPAQASGGCGLAFANTTTSSGALPLLANSILQPSRRGPKHGHMQLAEHSLPDFHLTMSVTASECRKAPEVPVTVIV